MGIPEHAALAQGAPASDESLDQLVRLAKRLFSQSRFAEARAQLNLASGLAEGADRRVYLRSVAKVGDDMGRRYTFNTAIAAVMELINAIAKFDDASAQGRAVMQEALDNVVIMLAPIVPHISHALWHALGHDSAVIDARWPSVDEGALARASIELVVQVNGKLRGRIEVGLEAKSSDIEAQALADANVQRFTTGKQIKKVIVVPGKLVNVVVA